MALTDLLITLITIVSPAFVAVLTWASTRLATFLNAKVDNEYLRNILLRLDDAVLTAVKELEQTVVEEIKSANADGQLTPAEKLRIKDRALANVKSYLGPKGMITLGRVMGIIGGDLEGFISSRIEATLHDLRMTKKVVNDRVTASNPLLPAAS